MGRVARRRAWRHTKRLAKKIANAAITAKPNAKRRALLVLLAGGLVTAIGVAMVYVPAGVILAGIQLTALALLVIDVPRGQ